MALEKAATTVRGIDTVMRRAKDGPGSFHRCPQGHVIDHSRAPNARYRLLATHAAAKVSTFSRSVRCCEAGSRLAIRNLVQHSRGDGLRSKGDRARSIHQTLFWK